MRQFTTERANAEALATGFKGLPPGFTHWELCDHLATAREPLGLDSDGIWLLTFYLKRTKAQDWEPGAEPVIAWPKFDLCVLSGWSEDKLSRVENRLCAAGLIAFRDSPSCKRRAYRGEDGLMSHDAAGISLAPLGARALEIAAMARQVHEDLRSLRNGFAELFQMRARLLSCARSGALHAEVRVRLAHLLAKIPRRRLPHLSLAQIGEVLGEARAVLQALFDLLGHPEPALAADDRSVRHRSSADRGQRAEPALTGHLHRTDAVHKQPESKEPCSDREIIDLLEASPETFRDMIAGAQGGAACGWTRILAEACDSYAAALALPPALLGRLREQYGIARTLRALFSIGRAVEAGAEIRNPAGYAVTVARQGAPGVRNPRAGTARSHPLRQNWCHASAKGGGNLASAMPL